MNPYRRTAVKIGSIALQKFLFLFFFFSWFAEKNVFLGSIFFPDSSQKTNETLDLAFFFLYFHKFWSKNYLHFFRKID